MTKPSRLITPETRDDDAGETSLRPLTLGEFIGQDQARANLKGQAASSTSGSSAVPSDSLPQ